MKSIKIKTWICLLCVGTVLFSSCIKKNDPPQLIVIPADAVFVASFENATLIKKGGLDKLKEFNFSQKINGMLAEQDPAVQSFFNKIIENPASFGLDTEQSFIYGVKQGEEFYIASTFKVGNLSNLNENLTELAKLSPELKIEDKGDYKLISPEKQVAFFWNKDVLFLLFGTLEGIDIGGLFTVADDKSIVSNADFQDFRKQKSDIGFWTSYSKLIELINKAAPQYNNLLSAYVEEYSGIYARAYLDFKNGEILLTGTVTPKAKLEEFWKKYPIMKDFNQDLLADFPETSFLSTKFAFNIEEYLKLIKSMTSLSDPTIGQAFEAFESTQAQTIINGLGGDFMYSIFGFAQGPLPIPLIGISFSVKSEADFNNILALLPQGAVQQTGSFYSIGSMGFSAYFAYKDNRVFITDDSEAITAFTGNGYPQNLKNTSKTDIYKKNPYLFYLNLDLDSYPASIKTLLQKSTTKDIKPVISFLEKTKDFTYTGNKNEFTFSFKFKDNSQNGLKTLLKSADELTE
jgi:hypothetical protein